MYRKITKIILSIVIILTFLFTGVTYKNDNKEKNVFMEEGMTYINGILLVNKKYPLPKDYDPKVNKNAYKNVILMQKDAFLLGLNLPIVSGYRSYSMQNELFNKYKSIYGQLIANTYFSKIGHLEHQSGLTFNFGYKNVPL